MTTPNENPLDKLAALASQRTARTDRLYAAVRALLDRLDAVAEVGDRATSGENRLALCRLRSNVGYGDYWSWSAGERGCYLDAPLGHSGYLHGDFNVDIHGPTRGDLIAFGRAAPALVADLTARFERQIDAAEQAEAQIQGAHGA